MAKKPKQEPPGTGPYESKDFKDALKKVLAYKPQKKVKPKDQPQG